jgi:hypothetical protein
MEMLSQSWRFLRGRPRLLVIPAISMVATTLVLAAFELPALYLGRHQSWSLETFIGGTAAVLPLTFISVFFNVAFLEMVKQHLDGEEPSVRQALRATRARLPVVFAWALLTATVGTLLRALSQIPILGGWLGSLISWIGDLAWSLATFFVVPVLVVEKLGPVASVRRSASVFKERWGESVTGDIAIGTIVVIAAIPGFVVGLEALSEFEAHDYASGLVIAAVAAVLLGPVIAVGSAVGDLFSYFLYRHATEGIVVGPFSSAQLDSAMEPKKRRFWQD